MSKESYRWWTFAVVSMALFMGMLDNLVVTTALPTIQRALGASVANLEWIVNAYTLGFAVLMIPAAALGERFGRRRVLLTGVALFTGGSALAALASGAGTLILARAVQGIGSAMIAPLTLTILVSVFPAERRAAAIGLWSGVSGLGLAAGPLVGGAIVNGLSWNAVFWLNVPIGALLLVLGRLRIEETKTGGRIIDPLSVALVTAGLFSVVFGLIRGNALGWGSPLIVASLVAGAALLVVFALRQRTSRSPMLDLNLFASRSFSAANAVGFLSSFAMFGSIFFITLFVQGVWGWKPLAAGLGTMPWTGTIMLAAPVAGALAGRLGARRVVVVGMAAQAAALFWIGTAATAGSSYASLLPAFILGGLGMGLSFAPLSATAMAGLPAARSGEASGAYNTLRELGGVFGVSVLGAVFAGVVHAPSQFVDGFHLTLKVAAVILAFGSALSLLLPSRLSPQLAPTEGLA
ncbi:MAG TPA: DHA2 family efflux MFS transporter permease subunit [Spirochaetia bacterium]|nr:DHA2 family efflux MFS transporter permease subunit [Spirochaetia bacterium]